MKKVAKKLSIKKETIAALDKAQLSKVIGAGVYTTSGLHTHCCM